MRLALLLEPPTDSAAADELIVQPEARILMLPHAGRVGHALAIALKAYGADGDDVIVVRSLTKVLAIPGLRAGYAVAPAALARRLRALRPPWSANALALAALAAAAQRPRELAALADRAQAEREDQDVGLRLFGRAFSHSGALMRPLELITPAAIKPPGIVLGPYEHNGLWQVPGNGQG